MEPECFVVMPVTDPEGYVPGHFMSIYQDILAPACEQAGYKPTRADQVREANIIHLDILRRLLESPMVICDLSSRNPNVLFELGLRQAFDRPVVLVQEVGTPQIFDIAPIRYIEYRREQKFREVVEDQNKIAKAITSTKEAYDKGVGVNSIVRILALTKPASLPELQNASKDPVLQIIRAELSELRQELRRSLIRRSIQVEDELFASDIDQIQATLMELSDSLADMSKAGNVDQGFPDKIGHVLKDIEVLHSRVTPTSSSPFRTARFYNRVEELHLTLKELESRYLALSESGRGTPH